MQTARKTKDEPEEIYVLNKQVRLLQPSQGFRTSLDSVMLAAACSAKEGELILDLGCGVGGAGFCVLRRVPATKLIGVDIQADCIDLANQNIALNEMPGRAIFICGDVRDNKSAQQFHHVICNPPYQETGKRTPSPQEEKEMALAQDMGVEDWIDSAFHCLKSNGMLTIIHRADAIDKILQSFGKRFGAVEIIPLWPRKGVAAKRVIVRAIKDRKSAAVFHAGIVLHEESGAHTKEADAILRGQAIA